MSTRSRLWLEPTPPGRYCYRWSRQQESPLWPPRRAHHTKQCCSPGRVSRRRERPAKAEPHPQPTQQTWTEPKRERKTAAAFVALLEFVWVTYRVKRTPSVK